MKRKILTAILVLGVVAMVAGGGTAYAGTLLGELCWQMNPFIDTIRLALDSDGPIQLPVHGRWRAGSLYSIAISGTIAVDPVHGGLDLSFTGADYSDPAFSNSWDFHAKLAGSGPNPLNGPWFFRRDDGFTNSGALALLPNCQGTTEDSTGPTANEAK
jgi:hypothetical protein